MTEELDAPDEPPTPRNPIKDAVRWLDEAIAKAQVVPNHPMLPMFQASRAHLIAFVRASESTVRSVNQLGERLRSPISEEDVTRIGQDLRSQVANMNRAYGARTFLAAAAMLVGIGLACGYAGVWLGFREGVAETDVFRTMDTANATEWTTLMQANKSVVDAVKLCGGPSAREVATQDGRRACAVPMYLNVLPKAKS